MPEKHGFRSIILQYPLRYFSQIVEKTCGIFLRLHSGKKSLRSTFLPDVPHRTSTELILKLQYSIVFLRLEWKKCSINTFWSQSSLYQSKIQHFFKLMKFWLATATRPKTSFLWNFHDCHHPREFLSRKKIWIFNSEKIEIFQSFYLEIYCFCRWFGTKIYLFVPDMEISEHYSYKTHRSKTVPRPFQIPFQDRSKDRSKTVPRTFQDRSKTVPKTVPRPFQRPFQERSSTVPIPFQDNSNRNWSFKFAFMQFNFVKFVIQSVLHNMAGVETCFLKLSEELNWRNQVQKM